ncbi:intracellular protein transport protein USO1-like [Belonocnema kinseyi]|uniref:intracellular protein transport protein USO1-like n=1 Tax=Belonocnema kinseyi TaxID=2817044 RepID=UPI00143DC174|nr:intracellular protein transport protein USO1-like [Belonocnema kinseyi]XP_033227472.1 intracellular protein transport protein USO1-like [Belonocnema kinseyi]XP_033227473.1 intracellular protein transport protein USO1-like [Belonocnema kinseyi]
MSASAIKSSMPGVGASPSSAGHSMLPMNMMAQKVVPGSESGSGMKPLTSSGLSYVTLQPANHPQQPLSLVQDHRAPVYQPPPTTYSTNNAEKEAEPEKVIANGVEPTKSETQQDQVIPKPSESSRNNNLSPETPGQESSQSQEKKQSGAQSEPGAQAAKSEAPAASSTPVQSKPDEKKLSVNNGSKDTEAAPASSPNKLITASQKVDESPKSDAPKAKAQATAAKPVAESATTVSPKSEAKVTSSARATKRKPKEPKDVKGAAGGGGPKPKRNRIKTQPYQSPLPEIAMIVKTLSKPVSTKAPDDKLIVFYKNEFLAVRNTEGSFFVCQAMQNIYKSSRRIRIRWLSQDKNNGEIYSPDFYDHTDFDCILTNLNLNKVEKNKFQLTKLELLRTENILKRAIDVEAGVSEKPRVTEEHPDGLDLSLFKDESQLKKRKRNAGSKQNRSKKKAAASEPAESSDSEDEEDSDEDSEDDEEEAEAEAEEEKPVVKVAPAKKPMAKKALAIAKTVAKGPSRKDRALNRRQKSSLEDSSPAVSAAAAATSAAATAPATTTTAAAASKSENAKKTSPEVKKDEAKKAAVKPQSNNTSGVPRTKARGGAVQNVQESKSTTSRPKRVATTGVAQPSTEEASSRKKSRGRA